MRDLQPNCPISTNEHTEAVLLEFITGGEDTADIIRNGLMGVAEKLVQAGRAVYYLTNEARILDFKTELRKLLLSGEFTPFLQDMHFPNGLEAGIDKLTDAIIKDMNIETERK